MRRFKNIILLTLLLLVALSGFNEAKCKNVKDSDDTSLTVYNQNFALVKDYRNIKFNKGHNEVEIDNVASLIDPTSVSLKSLTSPNSIVIREQNYRYDLIEKSRILNKMVGKEIKFRNDGIIKEGILLNPATVNVKNPSSTGSLRYNSSYSARNTGSFAIKTSSGILLTSLGDIIINKLPEGLYPRPILQWKIDASRSGNQNLELAYLTDGVNWYADYIATVNKNDNQIDLTAWVTLDNNSGISYKNADLKLVAGDVRKIRNRYDDSGVAGVYGAVASRSSSARQFKEEAFFEYHLYSLDRKTDIKNNETKQLTLTTASSVPATKQFIYDPLRSSYYNWINQGYYYYRQLKPGQGRDTTDNKKVNVMLEVKNSKKNHLGIPLPKGKVRVYKRDSAGDVQFIGEDQIDHTPEDEKINLYLGDAFDIVGERKAVSYKDYSNYIEVSFEFEIRNHKKQAVSVDIYERVFGDWTITQKSDNYTKKDAHTIVFPVNVAAKGKKKVTYTIEVKK